MSGLWVTNIRLPNNDPSLTNRVCSKESFRENDVSLIDAAVQVDGPHQGLETVGHGVSHLRIVAQVGPVGVQHVVLQAQSFGQHSLQENEINLVKFHKRSLVPKSVKLH